MNNAHSVEIVHSIQDLADESAGIFFCVKSLLHYPIKEFSTGHAVKQINETLGTQRAAGWCRQNKSSLRVLNRTKKKQNKTSFLKANLKHEPNSEFRVCPTFSPEAIPRKGPYVTAAKMHRIKGK